MGRTFIGGIYHNDYYYPIFNYPDRSNTMLSFILAIPSNVFLVAAVIAAGFPTPFFFTFAAVSVVFIELVKTLFLATHQARAMLEFGMSLALLLLLSLYIQSQNAWGQNNLTICALIQLFDTVGGFIGTFLLARRDFGGQ